MKATKTAQVFVYGSLLSGESNHRVLAGAALVGEARTEARYTLHDLGAYLAMTAGGEHAIAGELYEVDAETLAALDRLEGHPHDYRRTTIVLADGREVETYLLTRAQIQGRAVIASGNWRAHRKERRR
jgi:gamma-glutamylcyclotransferase (GGCT)/AIG2-like uncharacterized protein YtfP